MQTPCCRRSTAWRTSAAPAAGPLRPPRRRRARRRRAARSPAPTIPGGWGPDRLPVPAPSARSWSNIVCPSVSACSRETGLELAARAGAGSARPAGQRTLSAASRTVPPGRQQPVPACSRAAPRFLLQQRHDPRTARLLRRRPVLARLSRRCGRRRARRCSRCPSASFIGGAADRGVEATSNRHRQHWSRGRPTSCAQVAQPQAREQVVDHRDERGAARGGTTAGWDPRMDRAGLQGASAKGGGSRGRAAGRLGGGAGGWLSRRT